MKKYLSTFLLLLGQNKADNDILSELTELEPHLNWFPERLERLESEKSAEFLNAMEKFHLNPFLTSVPNYADAKRWLDDESLELLMSYQCLGCKAGTWLIKETLNHDIIKDALTEIGIMICKTPIVTSRMPFTSVICKGVVEQQFGDMIFPIIFDKMLSEQIFCTFFLMVCDQDKWEMSDTESFVYDTIHTKPAELRENTYVNDLYKNLNTTAETPRKDLISLVLFSDLHLDYQYTEGMNNDCGRPLCCRGDSGLPKKPEDAAGKWGDFKCDLAPNTFRAMLDYIKNDLKPDAVFWTGDTVPHNLESLTPQNNIEIIKNATIEVADRLSGISVFPSLGNHDTYPQDLIYMDTPRENDVINGFSPGWLRFLPEDQKQKFLDWGYYSSPLHDSKGNIIGNNKNAKVISINSNICYTDNFNIFVNFHDPGNMLEWLENELRELEKIDGAAIIIGHVPNIEECLRTYGRRYHAIVDRYQNVIRWQLFGHIHQEQYQVITDVVGKKPIGLSFIIGSMTTYKGKPPSFNEVLLDPDTLLPVNLMTYAFNLTHMNTNPEEKPRIDLVWDYIHEYNLTDMSPNSFYNHSLKIYYDDFYAKQYRNNRYIRGPGDDFDQPCDYTCRLVYHCQTVSGDWDEWESCRQQFNYVKKGGVESFMSFYQWFNHAWFKPKNN